MRKKHREDKKTKEAEKKVTTGRKKK